MEEINLGNLQVDEPIATLPNVNIPIIKGEKGDTGASLEFNWQGTQLGIRVQGTSEYSYVDLEGPQGSTGNTGPKGDTGSGLEFVWQGTQLGVRVEGTSEYTYVDLEGPQGSAGSTGPKGDTGAGLEFVWSGTRLGVRVEGTSEYTYTDLQGARGDTGATGPTGAGLEFVWNGTQLGVRIEGTQQYEYTDLKGSTGATGATGATGPGLEFTWQGTQLGVRVEGSQQYTFVDLVGPQGSPGNDGHTPVKGTDYFTPSDIAEIQQPITDIYDSTQTYAVGDYCIYNNVLYKCIGATTGNFDSTKWTATKITEKLTTVVDNLTSTSATDALSAKQGKVLNDMIGDIETVLTTITTGGGVS